MYNTAIYGGVISCTQGSVMLTNSNFTYNLAFKSGVAQLESQAYMSANMVSFYYNRAMTVGGVIVVLTDSYFNLVSCDFYYN